MKERPILFSGPMIRALLAGTKTQTRRVVKPQPPTVEAVRARAGIDFGFIQHRARPFSVTGPVWAVRELMGREPQWTCPYGFPGDRLWVRETWYDDLDRKPGEAHELNIDRFDDGRVEGIEYRASHDCAQWEAG